MKQFCLLALVFGVSLAAPSFDTSFNNFTRIHPGIGGRIVGGEEADIRDLPWQAALLRNGAQICGAMIISDDTILTAAHCVAPTIISNINQLSFRVGSSQWRNGGQQIFAREIILHERYQDCEGCPIEYDIAAIKLQERIRVPNAVPLPLAPENRRYATGTYAVVSGWGTTASGNQQGVETLRKVDVPVADENRCRSLYGNIINERTICAGYTLGGKDSCQGDSGGPFVINGELAGIVSFGAGCALPLFPGVYTSIPGYRQWIRQHTGL